MMSPLVFVILIASVAGFIALAGYIWVIKKYYWTDAQKEKRRKQNRSV